MDGLAWLECKVTGIPPGGDHTFIVGKEIDGKTLHKQAEPR
jgi:flavin reductase (DIM6/NTAB) family NADH-FMN oxidoreductase RutF